MYETLCVFISERGEGCIFDENYACDFLGQENMTADNHLETGVQCVALESEHPSGLMMQLCQSCLCWCLWMECCEAGQTLPG